MDPTPRSSVKVQLVQRVACPAHWIITLSEPGKFIHASLFGKTLHYAFLQLAAILDTIEFPINNDCPPIDHLEKHMRFVHHQLPRAGYCLCVEWV